MRHDPQVHFDGEPPPLPTGPEFGLAEHVHDIFLGVTAMIDGCTACVTAQAVQIAGDPLCMLSLHRLMQVFGGADIPVAPPGSAAMLEALTQESREQMVCEGLTYLARASR